MQLQIVKQARIKDKNIVSSAARYQKLAGSYIKIESIEQKDPKKFIKDKDSVLVALDGQGKIWSSEQLSQVIQRTQQQSHIKKICFVIGGPYGLSKELLSSSDHIWSLSNATLAGDIAWLVVWEQVYRAMCIINKHPYHHA